MKILIISILVLFLNGCASIQNSGDISRNPAQNPKSDFSKYKMVKEIAHFKVWQLISEPDLAPGDFDALATKLDKGYEAISSMIGKSDSEIKKFDVLLEGKSFAPGSAPRFPSVDDYGVIHLYIFPGLGSNYLQGLPHEIVHAFRQNIRVQHELEMKDYYTGYGFIEEAFAEYVSESVDPGSVSFVNYGYPRQVVAGYWLTTNQDIPLDILWNHHEINGKCVAQAYPIRTSFFFYLEEKYGRDKVLKLAHPEKTVTDQVFIEIFSKDLQSLSNEWRPWAIDQFEKVPNHDKVLQDWLGKTSIKFFPVCKQPFIQ